MDYTILVWHSKTGETGRGIRCRIGEFRIDATAVLMAVLMTHFGIKNWLLYQFNSDQYELLCDLNHFNTQWSLKTCEVVARQSVEYD